MSLIRAQLNAQITAQNDHAKADAFILGADLRAPRGAELYK